jgi:peptidoglycan/xylan/chitin deacetylase (PgdA/CDA1 family)
VSATTGASASRPATTRLPVLDPTGGDEARRYLREEYAEAAGHSRVNDLYYRIKPLLPRGLQLGLRRLYARRQAQREFPRWPVEPVLLDLMHQRLAEDLARQEGRDLEFVWFWPDGHRFAAVMTHDVEGPEGIANIPRVLEVERRHGVVSSWNFCGDWYEIPDGTFEMLRDAGCEIGLHGITHDDQMWRSREGFERLLPQVHARLRDWEIEGFRSPATLRNAEWMPELAADYDSSFPDTDPFEPHAGGCCSIFPYFLEDMVELPITLTQDHTAWEILRHRTIDAWAAKTGYIAEHNGLVNLILHPDYVIRPDRLALYDEFLGHLTGLEGVWLALPRDVARWWRRRTAEGIDAPGAVRGVARLDGDRVTLRAGAPAAPTGG